MRKTRRETDASVGLPYANNLPIIVITAILNLAMAFIFQYSKTITTAEFVTDATICGFTTVACDAIMVWFVLRKMRRNGDLPSTVPESGFIQRFPKNPWLFTLIMGLIYAVLMLIFSMAVSWFYELTTYTFVRFAVWKVLYSSVLSANIVEILILRLTQPDCRRPGDPVQTGTAVVKNPLPRKDTFFNLFNTVATDVGTSIIVGVILGSNTIVNKNVIIAATTRSGVITGGLITGLIISFVMIRPAAVRIRQAKISGELPPCEKRNGFIAWIPENPLLFALTLLIPTMLLSATVYWGILTFFGFEKLNFFQFYTIKIIYSTLLSKLVALLAIERYRQPDKAVANK